MKTSRSQRVLLSLALSCPRGQILSPWPWAKVLGLGQTGPWPCRTCDLSD